MKVREFLNSTAKYLTENKNETYSVKCFNYPVEYVGMGTHSDFPVEFYEPELEGVICIAKDDFDVEQIFQGYLCYPEEYPEFYKSTDFILCFGPEKDLDFEKILDSEIDLKNQIFYGLDENQINKILNKYVINENLNDSQRKRSILIQSAMPKKDTSDSQNKKSIYKNLIILEFCPKIFTECSFILI